MSKIILPDIFVDDYMPEANPTVSIIYIYGLRMAEKFGTEKCAEKTAEGLNILLSDVIKAFKYWHSKNLVKYNEETHEVIYINNQYEKIKEEPKPLIVLGRRPAYSAKEIAHCIDNDENVRLLFKTAEKCLNKTLSSNDLNTIFGFYDWLRMPLEVIEILLEYCVSNNHKSMRYIEKVAIDWAEKGIITPELANEHIKTYNSTYRKIMAAFGQSGRNPVPLETEYMEKWLKKYKASPELIIYACEKTVLNIGKPNFSYADKILKSLTEQGITTPVEAAEAAKARTKKDENKKVPAKNRFVNYEQRNWDFDELERLETELLNKDLKGK